MKPALGRFYTEEEDQVDNWAPVIVITNRLWKRHFNSDPNVIGKVLTLDQKPVTVIGLLPEDFSFFGDEVDFICPLEINRTQSQSKQGFIIVLGRIKKNGSMKQSQAEIDTIARVYQRKLQSLASIDDGVRTLDQELIAAAFGWVKAIGRRAGRLDSNVRSRRARRRPRANRPAVDY